MYRRYVHVYDAVQNYIASVQKKETETMDAIDKRAQLLINNINAAATSMKKQVGVSSEHTTTSHISTSLPDIKGVAISQKSSFELQRFEQ